MECSEKNNDLSCGNCKKGLACPRAGKIPLFSALPEAALVTLMDHSVQSSKAKDSVLFRAGQTAESVFIIRTGRVKLCKYDGDGSEYILDILHDGDAVWENLFLENTTFPYSAVCLTDVSFCEIRKQDFHNLLSEHPEVAVNLVSLLAIRLRDANEKALLLAIRDPRIRLAGFLLDRDSRCIGPEIKLRLEDIASSIGLRPETVSRGVSQFEKMHLIRRAGQGSIMVTDRAGLKKIYESG
jgi:CRP-like cAMP-binding protein